MNRIRKHTSTTMSDKIHVPVIICLDDDDDDDDPKIDNDYKLFLAHNRDDKPIKNIVRLVTNRERIQRANRLAQRRKRKLDELVRDQEHIQRENKATKISNVKVETLRRDVPRKVRAQEKNVQGDNKGRKFANSKAETLRKEAIQRDNGIAERRKKRILDELKAEQDVPPVRVNRAKELKAVHKTTRTFVPVTKGNKTVYVRKRKKNGEENVDKEYMSYLTWLVNSLKDPSYIDPPIADTQKESTIVPEKDLLVKVKDEPDLEPWSDYIIAVSDSPISDVFVASKSKNVIDADKESREDENRSSSCWFKKLMDVLEKPFDEEELSMLSSQVSMKKPLVRCREFRKGRERSYETDVLGKSYLEKFADDDDFGKEYQRVDGDDKARLEFLRGFFFYLENISQEGAFKPWSRENKEKLWIKKQCLKPQGDW